jgi:hypothetical protein
VNEADLTRLATARDTASSSLKRQMINAGLEEVDYISDLGTSVPYH